MNIYKNAILQGYDIFDSEGVFYNDVCTVYTSIKGTDMILSDRRSDILNNTPPICEDGCKYSGMNEESKKVLCECTPKKFINTNISETVFTLKMFEDIFFNYNGINYKVLGCYKLLYDKKNIIHNFGFYMISIMLGIFFILIPINLCLNSYQLKLKCYKLIKDKQNLGDKNIELNNDKMKNSKEVLLDEYSATKLKRYNNIGIRKKGRKLINKKKTYTINKNDNMKMEGLTLNNNNLNIKSHKIIINNNININNSINNNINNNSSHIQRLFQKQKTLQIVNSNFNSFQNQKIKNMNNSNIKRYSIAEMVNKNNNIDSIKKSTDSIIPLNSVLLKKPFEENKITIKTNEGLNVKKKIKRKSSKKLKINKNMNKNIKNNDINKDDIINERPEKEEDDNNEINEKFLYYKDCIKNIPEEERLKHFHEEELDQMEYEFAVQIDKRNLSQYYLSLLKKKQLIIFTFCNSKDYNIVLAKISLFICSVSVYFLTNTFFFNDANMHKIYEENGSYNFLFQIPQILYSTLISSTINILMKHLSLSQNGVIKIKQTIKINNMVKKTFVMIKNYRLKIIIFNILGFLILSFSYYYLTMFCAVYTNTQTHLLKDILTSFGFSLLYPFALYILPGIFRIPSLRAINKDKAGLYKFSQMIALI